MKQYRFGVLGAGNMGLAIAEGAVRAGLFAADEVLLSNRDAARRAANAARGFAVTDDCTAVYTCCDTVVLGIKPQNFGEVLARLSACQPAKKPLLVSIAAGVTFATLEAALGADIAAVRVMPNTPLLLGEGASALVKNEAATAAQLEAVTHLFGTMGVTAVFSDERMLNEIIPYGGSLPAYVYQFIEAFAQSAAAHGVARADALPLICKTVIGSAKMVLAGDKTPEQLIRAVCSPGGTTIEGVRVLERGLNALVAEACDQCIARAYELGK